MITVTERAAAGLRELRAINHAAPGQGVKLVPSGPGSIGLTIAEPGAGDDVVRRDGEPLLIVGGGIAGALDGAMIDCEIAVIEGQPKMEFTLRPPEQ